MLGGFGLAKVVVARGFELLPIIVRWCLVLGNMSCKGSLVSIQIKCLRSE